jgi:hypothetical protein
MYPWLFFGLLFFLASIIALFFSPFFSNLLVVNPSLGTGLVAILSALSAGIVNAIFNIVQAISSERIAKNQVESSILERRTKRRHQILDEQCKVITRGHDGISTEAQEIRGVIRYLWYNYSPNLPQGSLVNLANYNLLVSGNDISVITSEIISLGDKKLIGHWNQMNKIYGELRTLLRHYRKMLMDLSAQTSGRPEAIFGSKEQSQLDRVTERFNSAGGLFKRRLNELRIKEAKISY